MTSQHQVMRTWKQTPPLLAGERADVRQLWWALAGIGLVGFLQVEFALHRSINWDEFYFYGQIVDYTQNQALRPFQTLHVQLLQWIPSVAHTGVDGVIIGRMIMLACAFSTAGCIALVAGAFARREFAACAALFWLSAGFTMQHGWSMRTDPLATALLMGALAILSRSTLSILWIAICGTLVGAAGMVTGKAILYLPAFAGLAWMRWSGAGFSRDHFLRLAFVPVAAILTFGAFFFLHAAALEGGSAQANLAYVSGVSDAMILAGPPIYLGYAFTAALLSLPAVLAISLTFRQLGRYPRAQAIAAGSMLAPLAALLIYRNTLPYFYPMLLAPVICGSVPGIVLIVQRYGIRAVVICAALSATLIWASDGPSHLHKQRAIQVGADAVFAEPVGYLDFADMLPGHRKENGFLTRWGLENVYAKGDGYFREILETRSVPLLVTSEPAFNPTLLAVMNELPQQTLFHAGDSNVLRATYRPFWGPLWLAGKELNPGSSACYEVLVPGPYTVTGGDLLLERQRHEAGAIIELERGTVCLMNRSSVPSGIQWGRHLAPPPFPAPERPYWTDF